MDLFGILLEQLGFIAAILLLLYLISIVTRQHVSSDEEVPQTISMGHTRNKLSQA